MGDVDARCCSTCSRLLDGTAVDPVCGCTGCSLEECKNWKPKGDTPMITDHTPAESDHAPDTMAKPAHYASLDPDVISFCIANRIGFCEGNVIKYVCRWREKGGVDDLKKARNYIDRLIRNN